ncbi:MAG TPA: hypothetical protein PLG66_17485 [Calditrichia bacterium]|nr:hypothetical protein [Calditrichia bacterium]
MKSKLTLFMTFLMLIFAAACSDDSTGPGDLNQNDLEGTWDMTQYIYISSANSSVTADIMQLQGLGQTMVINSNGSYTLTTTVQGQSFTSSGQFGFENGVVNSPDPNTTVTLDGNTLRMETSNTSYDFGSGDEPATARLVYTRR